MMDKSIFTQLNKMLILNLQCPVLASHCGQHCRGSNESDPAGDSRWDPDGWRQGKYYNLGRGRELRGPLTLNWGFLEGYLELMAFEVVLEREKGFSKEKQEENAILNTTEGLESNAVFQGRARPGAWWGKE